LRIFEFIERARLNREQRDLLSDVARLAVQYSDGEGESVQNPIIISNARFDLEGTAAEFAWLIRRFGTMGLDWRIRSHGGAARDVRKIDRVVIVVRDVGERTVFFDITESCGKWPSRDSHPSA
jgi:hypothetical protein